MVLVECVSHGLQPSAVEMRGKNALLENNKYVRRDQVRFFVMCIYGETRA